MLLEAIWFCKPRGGFETEAMLGPVPCVMVYGRINTEQTMSHFSSAQHHSEENVCAAFTVPIGSSKQNGCHCSYLSVLV